MATLVSFHAHPDDECIVAGGVMRKAFEEGHRVVLVVATRGEVGEVPDGFLDEGEELWQRRVEETHASAEVLGAKRVEFLGYTDSGMMGEPRNDEPGTFWQADVEEAAQRLADILREEQAEVLTIYDDNGGYGHPDHIQVHRVGVRAAELAGTPRVYQGTSNRDEFLRNIEEAVREGRMKAEDLPDFEDGQEFGKPEAELTARVDAGEFAEAKMRAMKAHATQITVDGPFFALSNNLGNEVWGVEFFRLAKGVAGPTGEDGLETDLFAGLE